MSATPLNLCTAPQPFPADVVLCRAVRERRDNVLNDRFDKQLDHSFPYTISAVRDLLESISRGSKGYNELLLLESSTANGIQTKQILQELAVLHRKLWQNGRRLRVRFMGGEPAVQERIKGITREWEQLANISFDFVPKGEAEIRISFSRGGSWSLIGMTALLAEPEQPTMNFDLTDTTMDEANFRATVLHEFGHCLGCVHEHQQPEAGIRWNRDYIYAVLEQRYGWDRAKVDANFFAQLPPAELSNSTYDPHSIMHYYFPPEFTLDHLQLPHNQELSEQDIAFIRQCYPFPATPAKTLLLD